MATSRNPKEKPIMLDFQGKGKEDENAITVGRRETASLSLSQSPITHRSRNLESMTYMQIISHHCHHRCHHYHRPKDIAASIVTKSPGTLCYPS